MKVSETPQDCSLIPTIGIILWLGWMGIIPWINIYLLFYGSMTTRLFFMTLFGLSWILPNHFPNRPIGAKIGNWLAKQAEQYFGLKTTIEDEESLLQISKQNKPILFCLEPHDVLPFTAIAFHPGLRRIPGHENCCVLMSSIVFQIPIIKQIFTWMHGYSVDKESFRYLLKQEKRSLVIIPGGVQEVTFMNPSKSKDLTLFLKKRKGFIKLALETGSPVVPVFAFHLDGCYGYWFPRGTLVSQLARYLRIMPVFFWGRYGIPLGIPRPKQIHVVLGKPIDIPRQEKEISTEVIDKYHSMFLKHLEDLFERYKVSEGYGDRKLIII